MESISHPVHHFDSPDDKLQAISRDLEFIVNLLGASIYSGGSPNLFERLQEFSVEAAALQESLGALQSENDEDLPEFERRFSRWKNGVYEFIESNI